MTADVMSPARQFPQTPTTSARSSWRRCLAGALLLFCSHLPAHALDIEIGVTARSATDGLEYAVFSADGKTLATIHWGNTVHLWDVQSGRARSAVSLPSRKSHFALSADGRQLASWSDHASGQIQLHDTASGQALGSLPLTAGPANETPHVRTLDFNADGLLQVVFDGYVDGYPRQAYLATLEPGAARQPPSRPLPAAVHGAGLFAPVVLKQGAWQIDIPDHGDQNAQGLRILDTRQGTVLASAPGFQTGSLAADHQRAAFSHVDGPPRTLQLDLASGKLMPGATWNGDSAWMPYGFRSNPRFLIVYAEADTADHAADSSTALHDLDTGKLLPLPPGTGLDSIQVGTDTAAYIRCDDSFSTCTAHAVALPNMRELLSFPVEPSGDYGSWLSPDGNTLMVGSPLADTMQIWDIPARRQLGPN